MYIKNASNRLFNVPAFKKYRFYNTQTNQLRTILSFEHQKVEIYSAFEAK